MGGLSGEDRAAIFELESRYAQAIDDGDLDGVVACFTPEAEALYEDGQTVTMRGEAELREFFTMAFEQLVGPRHPCTHLLGGITTEAEGEGARSDATMVAHLTREPGVLIVKGLRYRDRLERSGGGWRIAHRHHTCSWEHRC
jgi:ketosteroid isomerase-like protein